MRRLILPFLIGFCGCIPKVDRGQVPVEVAAESIHIEVIPAESSPNIYLQAMFRTGSATDPVGQYGVANLTAYGMARAGAGDRSPSEVDSLLNTVGSKIEVVVDREWTSFRLRCHRDHERQCVNLFTDVITQPQFTSDEIAQIKREVVHDLTERLPKNEERLGDQLLTAWIWEAHPYAHDPGGRTSELELMERDDVSEFFTKNYVRSNGIIGLAGNYSDETVQTLSDRFTALAISPPPELVIQKPAPISNRLLLVVPSESDIAGFHLGYPWQIHRNHPDWSALYLAVVALGEHRQAHGRLFTQIRTNRGLNYGNYAYMEPFVQRGYSTWPEQGVLRQQGMFSIWLRPVGRENAAFALKLAVDELEQLIEKGLSQEQFEQTREYILGHSKLEATDPGRRLAYTLDSKANGVPNPLHRLSEDLPHLTLEDVNAAIQRNINASNLKIVAVSSTPEKLIAELTEESPTPIVYPEGNTPSAAQTERDLEISLKSLQIPTDSAFTRPAKGLFE